jgi:chromosome segregation ATPase
MNPEKLILPHSLSCVLELKVEIPKLATTMSTTAALSRIAELKRAIQTERATNATLTSQLDSLVHSETTLFQIRKLETTLRELETTNQRLQTQILERIEKDPRIVEMETRVSAARVRQSTLLTSWDDAERAVLSRLLALEKEQRTLTLDNAALGAKLADFMSLTADTDC